MKFTYYDQTVDLFSKEYFPEGPPERVVLNLSGGLDSASLLFLMCKYFPEVEKHIFTGDDANAPFEKFRAEDIVSHIKKLIPNHNIKSHDILPFDDRNPEIIEEVKKLVEERPEFYHKRYPWKSVPGNKKKEEESFYIKIAKPLLNERNVKYVREKHNCSRNLSGMTQNPPNEEMKRLGFFHLSETRRNEDREDVHTFNVRGTNYQPYARVNKLFVRGVLESHDLMKDLFPLTNSCTGTANMTNYWTKSCEECFWCHEKKWAFGTF